MPDNQVDQNLIEQLKKLQAKYDYMGQDLSSYLDGLLYSDYLTYWDYIHVDTLLSLQNPKTSFPDEEIFIMYHQITELYFKLSIHELKQICFSDQPTAKFIADRVRRVNAYFENLTRSFQIMIQGMEVEQFLKFRMSLLPASGFQSAQYRTIEIYATPFIELVDKEVKESYRNKKASISELYEHIYWKKGATELATGKKTLTLKQFEKKYSKQFIALAEECRNKNMWAKYKSLPKADRKSTRLNSSH